MSDGVWRDRRFRTYWLGQTVSEVGDRVSELALPLVAILFLDARPAQVGALVAAVWLPNLVSLFVGTWVDRRAGKQRLLIAGNLIQAAAIGCVPIAFATGTLSMPLLYLVAVVGGLGGVVYQTAYPPFFVQLVAKSQYVEANSMLSTTRSGSFIVGPPLAGGLVKLLSAPVALIVDACSFLVSAIVISRVRVTETPVGQDRPEPYRARLAAGIGYLRRHPYLRASLACATTVNLFNFVQAAVLILFATRVLDLGPGSIGLALGLGAVGGLAGAVSAAPLARRLGAGRTVALGCVLFGVACAPLPLVAGAPSAVGFGALAAAELVAGFGVMLFDINHNSIKAAVIHDSMRSRVAGAYSTINYGIRPVGALLGGITAEWIGLPATLLAAAAGGTLAVGWLVGSPVIGVRDVADLEQLPPERAAQAA